MIDPSEYNITIKKISIDGECVFKAVIKELPDVAEYGDTFIEAYELAIDTIQTASEMFAEAGKPFPLPFKEGDNSYTENLCYNELY